MSRETHKKFARRFSAALMILMGLASGAGITLAFGEIKMAAHFGILAILCILPTAYFGVKTERSKHE